MAVFDSFRVGAYRVAVQQWPNTLERHIYLWPHPSYSGAKVGAYLYFTGFWTAVGMGKNDAALVIAHFPYDDYDAVYRMLRVEDPCYLFWSSDDPPGPNTKLTWCQIASDSAPPGRGP